MDLLWQASLRYQLFSAAILREGKDYDQALYGSQGPRLIATDLEKPDTPPQQGPPQVGGSLVRVTLVNPRLGWT